MNALALNQSKITYLGDAGLGSTGSDILHVVAPITNLFGCGHRCRNDHKRAARDDMMKQLYSVGLHRINDTGRDGRYNASIEKLIKMYNQDPSTAIDIMNKWIGDTITPLVVSRTVSKFNQTESQQQAAAQVAAQKKQAAEQQAKVAAAQKKQAAEQQAKVAAAQAAAQRAQAIAAAKAAEQKAKQQALQTSGGGNSGSGADSGSGFDISEIVHSPYFVPAAIGAGALTLILLLKG